MSNGRRIRVKRKEIGVEIAGFLSELRRRRVWRVAGAYVLVVWMAVEIVLETFPLFGFPEWVSRAVVVLAFLGFPVTLILAWAFDITPQGVVRTAALEDVRSDSDAPVAVSTAPAQVVVQPRPLRLAGVFGAGIVVALVAFGAYSAFVPGAVVHPERVNAVAVLPFSDLSPAQDQAYFADGVAEELINRLARIPEIRVAARASSFAFRSRDVGLDEIGRRLSVDAVVEGSLRREGDQLRVTVELVDVRSGFQIWSQQYDRTASDIFGIQDEISGAVAEALRLQLVAGASDLRAGTSSVRAHDAYLLGLARWHGRTEADLQRALEYFQQAVSEDESYALAHAGIALTYAVLPIYSDFPADSAAALGTEAAARALALDAQLAEAHAALGQISQSLEWNLDAAAMAYRRALEFQPNYATGHQWYAETLLMMGRLAEARVEVDRALDIDPLSVAARYILGYLQTVAHDYDDARATLGRLAGEDPGYAVAQRGFVYVCLTAGCPDGEAEEAARAAFQPEVAAAVSAVIGAGGDAGRRAAALPALTRAAPSLPPAQAALLFAAVGARDQALERIEQAYEEGADPNLPFYLVHPLLDPLRAEPRFRAVADAIGVEAPAARLPGR